MKLRTSLQLLSAAGAASLVVLIGCQSTSQPKLQTEKPALLSADQKPKGRAELWSETCNRCHNARSPDSYNAHEWAVVMTHMRVRGYLTGEEQRQILEFLQSQ